MGAEAGEGGDVEDGHLLFERVDVDMDDFGVGFGLALGGDPGDVTINDEDEVGSLDSWIRAVAETEGGRVVAGKTHVASTRIEDSEGGDFVSEGNGGWHRFRISAGIA